VWYADLSKQSINIRLTKGVSTQNAGQHVYSTIQYNIKLVTRHNYVITVCSKKSDAKIEITITATNLIRIKYPLYTFNYHLSGANIANFNKIHCTVFEQQLFKKWNSKTEVSNMEKSP